MECYNCGCRLSEKNFCTACGVDVGRYKAIMFAANRFYNDGLERANVRDLTGAVKSLRQCLKFNKNHVDARNLLGLVYFEMGEAVAALSEWVISKNIREEKNLADDYINMVQSNQGRLDTINTTIKKFNVALDLCKQGSNDLAVIQLKKVLNLNPKYVKAHQLLALLFMEREEWDKALRELEKCRKIDGGDVNTLRYLKETEQMLHPGDERGGVKKKKTDTSATVYKSGNEVIIQPLNDKEPLGLTAFIQIAIGIIIGICVTYFLILPAKVQDAKDELNLEIAGYGEQIDQKNTEITELQTRISQLEQTNLDMQDTINGYEGTNGAMDANNYLIAAAYTYLDPSQDDMMVEQYLDLIGEDYLTEAASQEFWDLYEYLLAQIGGSVSESYYESGLEAYNRMDYVSAIYDLGKAYLYDDTNEDALYYLALSYYDSGDLDNARLRFEELIAVFPEGILAEKARQKLEEIDS
ncbi:MAG: tetratricopeptide repeat protein [Lachnospiraceae bacterium]|nr:tetratricopeptide repeat protein [Lachnospiraceae bacterium]